MHTFRTPRARLLYESERAKLGLDKQQSFTTLEGMTQNMRDSLLNEATSMDSDMREAAMFLNIDATEQLSAMQPSGIDNDVLNAQSKLDQAKNSGNQAWIEQEQNIVDSLANAKRIDNGQPDTVVPFKNDAFERRQTREAEQQTQRDEINAQYGI